MVSAFTVVTLGQRPDLEAQVPRLHRKGWPLFLLKDAVASRYWHRLLTTFPDCQILLCDEHDTVIAVGHTIPIVWDGTLDGLPAGWDAALEQGFHDYHHQSRPTALSALAIVVSRDHQKQGLSSTVIRTMKSIAVAHNLCTLLAPVRPTLKSRYPLTPMERYIQWKQADGSPFDPWLRVHWRLGAELLRLAPRSIVITGTVAEWEAWTDMRFPESGDYIVPGALQPVHIDCEQDVGHYEDPNVWMRYTIRADEPAGVTE